MTKRVFISYRREDAAPEAGRLYDRFSYLLGKKNVFLDVGAIDAGEDFEEKIKSEIGKAGAIIVLIGRRWLAPAGGDDRPRLLNDRDHVRTEVRAALQGKALVLPVLVDGAPMPDAELLPADIADITRRNAPPLRSNSFDSDTDFIARKCLGLSPGELLWEEPPVSRKIWGAAGGMLLAAAAFFLFGLAHWFFLHRSIAETLGGDAQMETVAGAILVFGFILGFRRAARRRRLI
jgi:TIR domain